MKVHKSDWYPFSHALLQMHHRAHTDGAGRAGGMSRPVTEAGPGVPGISQVSLSFFMLRELGHPASSLGSSHDGGEGRAGPLAGPELPKSLRLSSTAPPLCFQHRGASKSRLGLQADVEEAQDFL